MQIFTDFIYFFFLIAVKVVPRSIKHTPGRTPDCEYKVPLEIPHGALPSGQELSVIYTYSVTYTVSVYM